MKTILVTGCAGFIGFHLCISLLGKKYTIIGIDNLNDYYDTDLKNDRLEILKKYKNFIFYKIGISEEHKINKLFIDYKIDRVCHLAAQAGVRYSLENPIQYVDSNIKGFVILMECMRSHNIKDLVYASSSSVYGDRSTIDGFKEDDKCDMPASLYAVTKKSNELIAYVYHSVYAFRCTGFRLFSVYGPWGRPDMAYFNFTDSILKGKPLTVFNFGKSKRDLTYIGDIIPGLVYALENPFSWEIINLGNSKPVTILRIIKILEKELHRKAKINLAPQQPGDVSLTHANITHAKKILGYQPKTKIEEGIHFFVKWYKDYYINNETHN